MASPEVEAAARADALKDVPPVAAPTGAARRGAGRPKATGATPAPPGASTPPRSPGRPPGSTKPKLAPKLAELFAVAGVAVAGMGLARGDERLIYDAERIMAGADRLALALDRAAQESPALRRTLEMLVSTSTWGELITATGAILLPIAANHGALPEVAATMVGAPPPPARISRSDEVETAGDARSPAAAGNGATGWPPQGRVPLDVLRTVTDE